MPDVAEELSSLAGGHFARPEKIEGGSASHVLLLSCPPRDLVGHGDWEGFFCLNGRILCRRVENSVYHVSDKPTDRAYFTGAA